MNSMQPEELASLFVDAMQLVKEAVLITTAGLDPPGPQIVYANESFCRMTGYAREELIGKTPHILQGPKTDRPQLDRLRRQLYAGNPFDGEMVNYRKDGSEYVAECYIVPLRNDAGEITHWMASERDVTDRRVLEERLRYQALHDPLTNLPNRVLFMERLEHALSLATRERKLSAVLFVDLDDFKVVNDSLGHEAGDLLLMRVAECLRASLRSVDTVARFGGDEFGILLEGVEGASYVTVAADRIMERLRETFVLNERKLVISCSMGIVLAAPSQDLARDIPGKASLVAYEARQRDKAHFVREVLRKADLAMYEAKQKGKGRYQIFDPGMNTRAQNRLGLESLLRQSLERQDFVVHYQPIISLETGKVLSLEALVRWHHPERGLLAPSEFIPMAEETGLIVDLGWWVLEEACSQVQWWQEHYPSDPPLRVGVNLSASQFYEPDLVRGVAEVLARTDLAPQSLELEITENVAMENVQASLAILSNLKSLEIGLALDDFGAGNASLAYLRRFPMDTLKIDGLFIAGLDEGTKDEVIVAAIIEIAHGLGLTAIPERVETAAQLRWLREMGCDMVQGFYFSKPLPSEAVGSLLRRNLLEAARIGHGRREGRPSHQ